MSSFDADSFEDYKMDEDERLCLAATSEHKKNQNKTVWDHVDTINSVLIDTGKILLGSFGILCATGFGIIGTALGAGLDILSHAAIVTSYPFYAIGVTGQSIYSAITDEKSMDKSEDKKSILFKQLNLNNYYNMMYEKIYDELISIKNSKEFEHLDTIENRNFYTTLFATLSVEVFIKPLLNWMNEENKQIGPEMQVKSGVESREKFDADTYQSSNLYGF